MFGLEFWQQVAAGLTVAILIAASVFLWGKRRAAWRRAQRLISKRKKEETPEQRALRRWHEMTNGDEEEGWTEIK